MNDLKILLGLLPFWTPLIPPQGISRIKGYLRQYGYSVRTVDANLENGFRDLYNRYQDTLRKYVPENKQGNLYNIANDVMRDHMLAHINHEDEVKYIELVKIIVNKVFFCDFGENPARELSGILTEIFHRLENYFGDLLDREKPDVLGLSVYRDNLPTSLFVFRLAKKKYPGIMTVMGGSLFTIHLTLKSPNLEFFMEKTKDYIDKIIVGQGEILLLKLLRGELPESQRLFTKEDIGGETLGFTSVDMFDFSDFNPGDYPYMAVQGSASCPNNCSFCNVSSFYGQYRQREPGQIVDDMVKLYEKYGGQLFHMLDALLNDVGPGIAGEIIERGLSFYWDGYFRVSENLTREKALFLRRGGLYRARLGFESGSQDMLNLMNKGITVEQIRQTISNLAGAGIKTTLYVLVGHPGETEEDFQKTLDLVEELKNDIWEAECNPFLYFYSGQGKNDDWAYKKALLYPEWAKDMLITQTWFVNDTPTREQMYNRIARFTDHSRRLGTATPWAVRGVVESDRRWKKLHKNAVPPAFDFIKKKRFIDENKFVKELVPAAVVRVDEEDFEF